MEICPHYFYLYVVWMFSLFNIFKGMDCKDQVHIMHYYPGVSMKAGYQWSTSICKTS